MPLMAAVNFILKAQIKNQATLDPEQTPNLTQGNAQSAIDFFDWQVLLSFIF